MTKKKKPAVKKAAKAKSAGKNKRKTPGKAVGKQKEEPKPEEPAQPANPFMGQQYVSKDNVASVHTTDKRKGKKVTQTVTHYGKISKEEALELFCNAIKKELDMTGGGVKTFRYLYSKVQASDGLNAANLSLYVDKADCMKEADYTSIQSVFNGVNELIDKGIIAKSGKMNVYFINPNFFRPADFLIITEYYKVNDEESK